VHCWHTYNGNLLYSYKYINYTQPVVDIQFHPFDNLLAMCSIGPLHQVYVFQHAFNEADIEAKPFQQPLNATKGGLGPSTTLATSTIVSDTDGSMARGRMESSGDELSRTATSKNDTRNRRLAVVNKILDEMDDVIVSRRFRLSDILIRKSSVTYAEIRRCGDFPPEMYHPL
jgi:hypothetical protein